MIGRPTDAQAQRRQRILVALAGLLACSFVLDLQLPLGVANAVLYSAVVLCRPPVNTDGCRLPPPPRAHCSRSLPFRSVPRIPNLPLV